MFPIDVIRSPPPTIPLRRHCAINNGNATETTRTDQSSLSSQSGSVQPAPPPERHEWGRWMDGLMELPTTTAAAAKTEDWSHINGLATVSRTLAGCPGLLH